MLKTAAYGFVLAAFVSHLGFLIWRTALFFKNTSKIKRWAIMGISGLLLVSAFIGAHSIYERGLRTAEHDFASHSLNFFRASWDFQEREALFEEAEREVAPLAWFSLIDYASGFSLPAILASQKLLLFFCAALIFAALLLGGFAWPSAAFAALLLALNFLSWITMQSFSSTLVNLFYFLSAICALAAISAEGRERFFLNLGWFLSAAFLVLSSRYEFFPVLVLGFLIFGKKNWESALIPTALFAAAAAVWIRILAGLTKIYAEPYFEILTSARHHLGYANLAKLFPIPLEVFAWLPYLSMGIAAVLVWRLKNGGNLRSWILFSSIWGIYFASIYTAVSRFEFDNARHHLYFFIPFIFLAAVLLEALWRLSVRKARLGIPAAVFLAVYGMQSARHVEATKSHLRTDDREWQFLLKARRSWKKGCTAIHPIADSRARILNKYFPSEAGADCRLVYRSPLYQIVRLYGPVFEPYPQEAETFYGQPWMEETFKHAFYTSWHIPGSKMETLAPVDVRAGFYFLSSEGAARLEEGGWPRRLKKGSRSPFEILNRAPDYLSSLDICYQRALSKQAWGEVVACFDQALNRAPDEAKPELMAYIANVLEAMAKNGEAVIDEDI